MNTLDKIPGISLHKTNVGIPRIYSTEAMVDSIDSIKGSFQVLIIEKISRYIFDSFDGIVCMVKIKRRDGFPLLNQFFYQIRANEAATAYYQYTSHLHLYLSVLPS